MWILSLFLSLPHPRLSVSLMCVYVHVHLSLHECPDAHAYILCVVKGEVQEQLQVLFLGSHLSYVLRQDLSVAWIPLSRLAWLAIKLQGSTCLCLSVLGSQVCLTAPRLFFMGGAEFRSLCLYKKHTLD